MILLLAEVGRLESRPMTLFDQLDRIADDPCGPGNILVGVSSEDRQSYRDPVKAWTDPDIATDLTQKDERAGQER